MEVRPGDVAPSSSWDGVVYVEDKICRPYPSQPGDQKSIMKLKREGSNLSGTRVFTGSQGFNMSTVLLISF